MNDIHHFLAMHQEGLELTQEEKATFRGLFQDWIEKYRQSGNKREQERWTRLRDKTLREINRLQKTSAISAAKQLGNRLANW